MNAKIEEKIRQLLVYQYAFIDTQALAGSPKIRARCRATCPFYGTSWSCPPAVGRLERCRAACLAYPHALVFSTMHGIPDDAAERIIRRRDAEHEHVADAVEDALLELDLRAIVRSGSVCARCESCTFPKNPCRHPAQMHPCLESCGFVIADIAESCNMDYYLGEDTRIDFSIAFYRNFERS